MKHKDLFCKHCASDLTEIEIINGGICSACRDIEDEPEICASCCIELNSLEIPQGLCEECYEEEQEALRPGHPDRVVA